MTNDQVLSCPSSLVSSKSFSRSTPVCARLGALAASMAAYHWPLGMLTTQPVAGVMTTVTVAPSAAVFTSVSFT